MANVRPIRTPWIQYWRRIQSQFLPVVVFAASLVGAIWLWGEQAGLASSVGEAQVTQLDLTAPADGLLVAVTRQWQPFDAIVKDEMLVRLDDGPTLALLSTSRKRIDQLQKDVLAADARLRQEQVQFERGNLADQNDTILQLRRLELDIERLRLDLLDRQASIETDALELQRQIERYEAIEKLAQQGMETQQRLWDVRLRRDVVRQRKEGSEKALAEARVQLKGALERQGQLQKSLELPTTQPAPLETLLAPLRAAIAVEESRLHELQIQIQALVIRAPFEGMIRDIFRQPGQTVRLGDPIMTLVANEAPYVVTYVREHHRVGPTIGMPVEMRVRTLPARSVEGHVSQVGPQVVRVPLQHLRDPKYPEWGLPVRIDFPPAAGIRPGEMVDITFHREQR